MIYIINGPNLNLLGKREPHIYGTASLNDLCDELVFYAKERDKSVSCFQSNHEGNILDFLQNIPRRSKVIMNPGALAHTSVALRDCIVGMDLDVIEVHITNIASREEFRHKSLISDICRGTITGLGIEGYKLALAFFINCND